MSGGGGGGGGGMGAMFGTIFTGMSTGAQAEGMMMNAKTEREALEFNAKVKEGEAQVEEDNARHDIALLRQKMVKTVGGQRAGYAASGVSTESGSALDVLADTTSQAVLDQQIRQYQADLKSAGMRAQAQLNRYYGKKMTQAAKIGAVATKLGGMAKAASMW